ncbi:MAG: hypothetical protein AAFY91_13520, partial [Bacteroidota bacterium]
GSGNEVLFVNVVFMIMNSSNLFFSGERKAKWVLASRLFECVALATDEKNGEVQVLLRFAHRRIT